MMKHRYFNSLILENGLIKKTSIRTHQLNSEINWYLNLPKELKEYLPEIIDYSIGSNPYILMRYYDSKNLSELFVSDSASLEEWKVIVSMIKDMLNRFYEFKIFINKDSIKRDIKDMYYEKTLKRLDELKKEDRWREILIGRIKINHMEFSFERFLKDFENYFSKFIENDQTEYFTILHGDLCLSNIIFSGNKRIILIDPRGNFGSQTIYGDRYYDLAKISHSLFGGYDLLINDCFSLRYKEKEITYSLDFSEKQKKVANLFFNEIVSKGELNRIKFIESLLFISMIPLHSENFKRQLAFFSQGMVSFYRAMEIA